MVNVIFENLKQPKGDYAWFIYTSRNDYSDNLKKALLSDGFTRRIPYAAMICFIDDVEPLFSKDFFTFNRVRNQPEKNVWLKIAREAFEYDQELYDAYDRQISKMIGGDQEYYYIGYFNDEPVSIGTLLINRAENYAMLQNIGTRTENQNQGFAGQLTKLILNEAWFIRLTHVVLITTESSQPMFERAGFRQVSIIYIYVAH